MSNKKLISAIVLIIYIVALVPAVSFADDVTFYFADSFDGYVTNEKPSMGEIRGLNSRIYEHIEGKDKAMALRATQSNTEFIYTSSSSMKEFVWTFDINPLINVPQGTFTLGTSGTTIKIASFGANGRLTAHDGKIIGGISKDRFTKLTFAVNLPNKRCDFYINGNCVLKDWYLGSSAPASIAGISMKFSVNENENPVDVLIDNMYIYKGTGIIDGAKLPKNVYNPNSIEFTEEEEQIANAVYLNRTFDEADAGDFDGLTVYQGSYNKISVEEEKNGNRYLKISRLGEGDSFIQGHASSSGSKIFTEFDIRTSSPMSMNIFFRDSNSKDAYIFKINNDGELMLFYSEAVVAKLSSSKWTNIGLAIDFTVGKYTVYVDKKVFVQNQSLPNGISDFAFMRFQGGGAADTEIKIDNYKIYDGLSFREIEQQDSVELPSVMPTYAEVPAKLNGFVALHLYGESFFAKGKRIKLEEPAYTKDGRTLVPVRVISEGFGLNVDWDEANQKVTIGSDIEMTIGQNKMKVGSKTVSLEVTPELNNGRTYLPLRVFAEEALGKKVFWDDRGLIVIGDREFTEKDNSLANINNYMLYDRPDAAKILEIFNKTSANEHPRVMATRETFDRIVRDYNSNNAIRKWGDYIISLANQLIGVAPLESDYVTDGMFLTISRSIQSRIENLSMAYILTGDKKYVDRVWIEVEKSGNFQSWNTTHYLDTSTMMASFAVAYDWLYDNWSTEQRAFMEDKMMRLGLRHSYSEYHKPNAWWPVVNINWNPVCNGSTAMAAIALMDVYPEMCSSLLENALRGYEFAMNEFYPQGSWPEGTGYWAYTIQYCVRFCSSLDAAFGTDFNISNAPGFNVTPLDAFYNNGLVASNNFHDSLPEMHIQDEAFWFADRYDTPGYANIMYSYHENGLATPSVAALLYYNTDKVSASDNLPLDKYFVGTEAGSMRSSWDDATGTFVAFHGGNAEENHGHVDSGTFVIDMLGERLAIDIGADNYFHPEYFGTRRYEFYVTRPEGHNMVVINPNKSAGINLLSYSPIIKQESKARGAITVMDLTDAYDMAKEYKRAYILDDDRRSVVIRDEIHLKNQSEAYWFMHTKGDIEVIDTKTAVITQNGKKFLVRFITDAPSFELSAGAAKLLPTSPVMEGQSKLTGINKISLKFSGSGKVYVAAKIIPYDDPLSNKEFNNVSIDEWTIPDGDIQLLPKPYMLYADGMEIDGFNTTDTSYTVNVPRGSSVPQITAANSDDMYYEVANAADLSGITTVKFISKVNPQLYRYYTIDYREIDLDISDIDGMTRHKIYNLYASANPQVENRETNALDGDINTIWAFTGEGQYLRLDLGSEQKINAIGIAAYKGDTRSVYYTVDVSNDGINWTNVYVGATEFTNDLQIVPISEVSARYVKFTANGNSQNSTWTSIAEFATLYR